jgi:hypothetical protein
MVRVSTLFLFGFVAPNLLPLTFAAETTGPFVVMEVPAAEVRTVPQHEAAAAAEIEGIVEIPFLPGMDPEEYKRLKEDIERAGVQQLRRMPRGQITDTLSEPIPDIGFEGLNMFESPAGPFFLIPPDTHGAVGKTQFVQIVNSALAVYDKETGTRLKTVSLNSFFDYAPPPPFSRTIFDPRVVYDPTWNRWVVTGEAFPESSTVQFHFIGVSVTDDATGPFFIYRINVTLTPDELWDYPQLGMDQDAIIITANIFRTRFGTDVLAIAKARLYNGLSLRIPRFINLPINTAPPIVLDDNSKTFLITTRPGTPNVELRALTNSSRPDAAALSDPALVNVGFYTFPPDARQPGTTARLDTLDSRFQNASTQLGNSLFNVHTIDFSGFATPRWYEIDTGVTGVLQSGIFFATPISDDFNPSLTVNEHKDVFVTWSSTEAAREGGFFPQIRASGRLSTDPPGEISPGSVIFESPTFYTQFRWGDYSAITVDPTFPKCAWGVNEKVESPAVWGSFIFRTCFAQ